MAGHDYDLFVIGAGSGGVRAARLTALDGKRVAVAEEFRVGGVLRMVKVTPHIGVPYYLVDRNGDGRLEAHGEAPGVYFKLYSW